MALLNVNPILYDADFTDNFNVIRRQEIVDRNGRSTVRERRYARIQGIVLPPSKSKDNDVHRHINYQTTRRNIEVLTSFMLVNQTKGYQPDIIEWEGDQYLVNRIFSYAHFGPGFILAECDSLDRLDEAFTTDMYADLNFGQSATLASVLCN